MANPNGGVLIPANNPLEGPVPDEIMLTRPPLQLALAQIQFPRIMTLGQESPPLVAAFQESIRAEYPDYRAESSLAITLGPGLQDAPSASPVVHHRFKNADGWEITLTRDFVALATSGYRQKSDFAAKVGEMAESVRAHINPHKVSRLGVRFVDRVEGDAFQNIGKYINTAFLGASLVFGGMTKSLMTEGILEISDKTTMIVRWGNIPANHQILGLNIPVIGQSSWVLDADIHARQFDGFDPKNIAAQTEHLAGRAYAVFRSVFKDDFIRHCGGKI